MFSAQFCDERFIIFHRRSRQIRWSFRSQLDCDQEERGRTLEKEVELKGNLDLHLAISTNQARAEGAQTKGHTGGW